MIKQRFWVSLMFTFFALMGFAQSYELNLKCKLLKNYGILEKGTELNLTDFVHTTVNEINVVKEVFYVQDDQNRKIRLDKDIKEIFEFEYNTIEGFWDTHIITEALHNVVQKGNQYSLRKDMEEDALNCIQKIKEYGIDFNDPYLENYIYSLVAKIAPQRLIDGRPCNVNILIEQNPNINICCYPNGTIILSTGMLSVLHSEDELVALLAHEISHFVLDHSITNVNLAEKRQKKAAFWSGLLTGVTAVAEGIAAVKGNYQTPGLATVGVAAMSSMISQKVIDRLGMKFNHLQEHEADVYAQEILGLLGYDKNAMASALTRIEHQYVLDRNNAIYISSYTHPDLMNRIRRCGEPNLIDNKDFEKNISFAVTNAAMMKYQDRRFRQCLPYVTQNIENNVATADDYILKANCMLALNNTPESNSEALSLISKAQTLEENNINIYKAEIIANLRMKKNSEALLLLQKYEERLNSMYKAADAFKSGPTWESSYRFVMSETDWVKRMEVKLKGMMPPTVAI